MGEGARTARWAVTCDADGLTSCREALAETLGEWGFGDVAFEAQLLVTELLTNATRHAGCGATDVSVGADDGAVRIAVWDSARDRIPVLPHEGSEGLGLRIVTAAAPRWGITVYERGKRVWFELDRVPASR